MRIRTHFAICLVVVLVAAPAQADAATTRNCGQIGFTPNSDDGVFQIRARGIGCATARRVARASRRQGIIGGVRR